jgi:hypothetical protein
MQGKLRSDSPVSTSTPGVRDLVWVIIPLLLLAVFVLQVPGLVRASFLVKPDGLGSVGDPLVASAPVGYDGADLSCVGRVLSVSRVKFQDARGDKGSFGGDRWVIEVKPSRVLWGASVSPEHRVANGTLVISTPIPQPDAVEGREVFAYAFANSRPVDQPTFWGVLVPANDRTGIQRGSDGSEQQVSRSESVR